MSRKVWLAGVLLLVVGLVAVATERSRSQEESPPTAGRGGYGGGFEGRGGGEYGGGYGGEFGGGFAGQTVTQAPEPAAPAVPEVTRIWVTQDPEGTNRLHQLLENEVVSSLAFPEGTPLEEVLAFLREGHDAPLVMDTIALDELGLGPDEPVSISVANVRLGQALRLLLSPLELTCVVADGVILVTSEEEALTKLSIAVYDVRDLLLKGDYDSLTEIITATIASDTWAENGGGEAEIRAYPQRGSLIISQTSSVHQEIAALFAALRQAPFDPEAKPTAERRNNHVQAAAIRESIEAAGREYDEQHGPGGGAFSIRDATARIDPLHQAE